MRSTASLDSTARLCTALLVAGRKKAHTAIGNGAPLASPRNAMRQFFEGAEHLVRLAVVALFALVAFFVIRHFLVPPDFGKYGHFRPASMEEIALRTPVFVGREAYSTCHDEVVVAKNKGPHANVGCEACHGPLARHAQDFSSEKPVLPDTAKLCVVCHEADSAKWS